MKNIFFNKKTFFIVLTTLIVLTFEACQRMPEFISMTPRSMSSSESYQPQSAGGNGGGYDGKPLPRYISYDPSDPCKELYTHQIPLPNQQISYENGKFFLTRVNCQDISKSEISLADIEWPSHHYQTLIFQKFHFEGLSKEELPELYLDKICRGSVVSADSKERILLDLMIKSDEAWNNSSIGYQADVIYSQQQSQTQSPTTFWLNNLLVNKSIDSTGSSHFQSQDFELLLPSQVKFGQLEIYLNGKLYQGEVDCDLLNRNERLLSCAVSNPDNIDWHCDMSQGLFGPGCWKTAHSAAPDRISLTSLYSRWSRQIIQFIIQPGDDSFGNGWPVAKLSKQLALDGSTIVESEDSFRYYAFSLRFHNNWQISDWISLLNQNRQIENDQTFSEKPGTNFSLLYMSKSPDDLSIRTNAIDSSEENNFQTFPLNLGKLPKDEWIDFVFKARWTSQADGFFEVWVKFAEDHYFLKVLEQRDIRTLSSIDGITVGSYWLLGLGNSTQEMKNYQFFVDGLTLGSRWDSVTNKAFCESP